MTKETIQNIITAVLALLFLYTGLSKIVNHDATIESMKSAPLRLLAHYPNYFSIGIPAVEVLLSFLLLYPRTNRIGLYVSTALMLVFTVYVGVLLILPGSLPCSCGGVIGYLSWKQHLLLNIIFLLVSSFGLYESIRDSKQAEKTISTTHGRNTFDYN